MKFVFFLFIQLIAASLFNSCLSQQNGLASCNVNWHRQSKNSSGSMPCSGGDIGLNVWVEDGDILFYMAQSGTFDENNTMLKMGRIRIKMSPDLLSNTTFQQQLNIYDGNVIIQAKDIKVVIWVDVFKPVIHAAIQTKKAVSIKASYETWRYEDHSISESKELRSSSYKASQPFDVITYKDVVQFTNNSIVFYHRNRNDVRNIFDYTVHAEHMDSVKESMFNPIANNTFGGMMLADNMKTAGVDSGKYAGTSFRSYSLQTTKPVYQQNIAIILNTKQTTTIGKWMDDLTAIKKSYNSKENFIKTKNWWHQYWNRSYIFIGGIDSSMSINYQLFRYMLGCNAFGKYPTKFNGGLFTFDPVYVDSSYPFSPDFRLWDGGTFTAQNQRLVYYGMLKSGDYDVMKPQFNFYTRIQKNAELRSEVYWHHAGACFTEQIENFGLPNIFEYGLKRPQNFDPGLEYNAWLEYSWETVFEFCNMMLETQHYNNDDISYYIPFIESCLRFYDEHYQMLAKQRGSKVFDSSGHYVLYPTSAAETYKMTYNSTTVIVALQTVLEKLLSLPSPYLDSVKRDRFTTMLQRIPPISFSNINGHTTIAPAQTWQRIQNTESPQLYPVFPWGIYGIGKPGLDTAINTYKQDPQVIKNKSFKGWRQENIFAARLGLTDEAFALTKAKFGAGKHRFPAFFGPGYDWTPDHNWGGTAMIGLQEMLLQADDEHIYLLPAWPKDKDVSFKLHAPHNTIVAAKVKSGKVVYLNVLPASRKKDVIIMLK
ncbi:hypothetical protein FC093_18890 [Ilyomonas limi]|uniref:DUF5703 domain-containing protein n=1 Tax=Ilyomonas limi TaxID=2575867 RepID=A0A4U3KTW3_9BACT|nr:DUF5703 domain-containing protein [Ilyomonas limi]TKK65821.1 hypothetical protein FC093_18890 [Ilyomonas limi]